MTCGNKMKFKCQCPEVKLYWNPANVYALWWLFLGYCGRSEYCNRDCMSSRVESTYYWALCRKMGFPCGSAGKESACNTGDWDSIPRLAWRRERLSAPLFWPGEFHGLYSPWGGKESDMTERLSLHFAENAFWDFPGAPVVKNLPSNVG